MLSDKAIKEFHEIFKRKYGKEYTWNEATEAANNFARFVMLLREIAMEDRRRQLKLRDNPEGFHLNDHQYSCRICGTLVSGEQSWYDLFGISCIACRDARRKRIFPAIAYRSKDSWYSMWEFGYYWNAKPATVRKFVRAGKLKVRIVPGSNFHIFMIDENKGFLPPKPTHHRVRISDNSFRVEYEKVRSPFDEHGLFNNRPKKTAD